MAFLAECIRNIKVKKEGARERGRERASRRVRKSYLVGFQQAHTVTRVMSRNMPPVDKMMYSELRPKRRRGKEYRKRQISH